MHVLNFGGAKSIFALEKGRFANVIHSRDNIHIQGQQELKIFRNSDFRSDLSPTA
jgi:hypothetical protein